MQSMRKYFLPAVLVLIAAGIRLLPYGLHSLGLMNIEEFRGTPWNFSPIGALCLFGGACLSDRRVAYAVPLATLVLSDVGIGLLMGDVSFGLHPMIPAVYGSFLVMVALGSWLRKARGGRGLRIAATVGAGMAGELAFFLLTNFANWMFFPDLYPRSFEGLIACYVAAIPFFRNSLMGMAMYGTILFGGHALLTRPVFGQRSVAVEAAAPMH